jgi:hypothetical protein
LSENQSNNFKSYILKQNPKGQNETFETFYNWFFFSIYFKTKQYK